MLLDTIKTKLTSAGVVNGSTWVCFIGYAPDPQDQLVSLHMTGGMAQDTHDNKNITETFQLRVRAAPLAYIVCYTKWLAAFNALQDVDLASSGVRFIQALAASPLEFFDEKNRPNMTVNFRVIRDKG